MYLSYINLSICPSSDFKSSNTSSTSMSEKKTFTESNKSRTWEGVSNEFSGLFVQDIPPTIESQSETITGYHDNSFGEFQSVSLSQKPISEHSSGTFYSPVLTHMATPSTQSPQVVHSQFHTPLTLTSQTPSSALSESDLPSWLVSAVTYNASQLPPVYYLVYQVTVWTCLYVCLYICVYVCLFMYMYMFCTCMYMYMYLCPFLCTVYVHVHVCLSICMYMYMYICPFVCTCTSVHLYMYMYVHVHDVHVCTCTCTSVLLCVYVCQRF